MPRKRRDEIDDLLEQVDGRVHDPVMWSLLRRLSSVRGPSAEARRAHLDSVLAAVRASGTAPAPLPTWRTRTAQLLAATTAKIAIASTAAAAATGGLAATGNLPKPVETVVAAAANAVGLSIPIKDEPFDVTPAPLEPEIVAVPEPAAPAPIKEPVRSIVVAAPETESEAPEDVETEEAPIRKEQPAPVTTTSPTPSPSPTPACTTVAPSSPDGGTAGTDDPATTEGGSTEAPATEEPATEEPATEEPTAAPSDQAPGQAKKDQPSPSPSATTTESDTSTTGSEDCTTTTTTSDSGKAPQGTTDGSSSTDTFAPEPSPTGDGEASEPTAGSTEG